MAEPMKSYDIANEEYREYQFSGQVYRINKPVMLYRYSGSTTHRVVDSEGIVHCVPAPGYFGCVLRWKSSDTKAPVAF